MSNMPYSGRPVNPLDEKAKARADAEARGARFGALPGFWDKNEPAADTRLHPVYGPGRKSEHGRGFNPTEK